MSPCHPFRPVPGQCGPRGRGPLPAPPFDPRDYWATRKCVSKLSASLGTKLDKADVVDPGTATEIGKAADAKKTQEELNRILGVASDARVLAESKADKATTLAGYGITDAATKAELAAKADLVDGKVPAAQLPSYVDDVLEYDTMSAFPATGESGKIYVAKDVNKTYRWGGTQYVEISPLPVLDDTVTEESTNGVKSSGIWSWVKSLLPHWLTSDYAEPATVESVKAKADKATTLAGYGITDAVPFVEDVNGEKTAVTIGSRTRNKPIGPFSIANGDDVTASEYYSHAEGSETVAAGATSHAEGLLTIANGQSSHAEGRNTAAYGNYSHTEGCYSKTRTNDDFAFVWNGDDTKTVESPYLSKGPGTFNINPVGGLNGFYIGEQTLYTMLMNKLDRAEVIDPAIATANGQAADAKATGAKLAGKADINGKMTENFSASELTAGAVHVLSQNGLTVGEDSETGTIRLGAFTSIRGGYVIANGQTRGVVDFGDPKAVDYRRSTLTTDGSPVVTSNMMETAVSAHISASDTTFSNAVLAVGLNIDTNSVAVLNDIAATFGGFPLGAGETATTVGGLLAALAAAAAWLKKNKVQTLKLEDNSVETSAENGVAKLDGFFTESNSLLNGRLAYSRNATGLKDRAFNTLSFDGTEFNLSTALEAVTPTASGQPRDLLIVATATVATTISFTAGTIKGDKPTIDGTGTWLITLTEYAANTWYCRQIKMEDAA